MEYRYVNNTLGFNPCIKKQYTMGLLNFIFGKKEGTKNSFTHQQDNNPCLYTE